MYESRNFSFSVGECSAQIPRSGLVRRYYFVNLDGADIIIMPQGQQALKSCEEEREESTAAVESQLYGLMSCCHQ